MGFYFKNSDAIASLSSWQGWLILLIEILAGVMCLYYIFRWITAEDESQAGEAKSKLRTVVIIFVLSVIIPIFVSFVISRFT